MARSRTRSRRYADLDLDDDLDDGLTAAGGVPPMRVYATWSAYVGTDNTTVDNSGIGYSRTVGEFRPIPGPHMLNQHHDHKLITGHVDRYMKIDGDVFAAGVWYDTPLGRESARMAVSGSLRFVSGEPGGAGAGRLVFDDNDDLVEIVFDVYELGPLGQVADPAFPGAGFLDITLVDREEFAEDSTMVALAASGDLAYLGDGYQAPPAEPDTVVVDKSAEEDWGFHALIAGAGIDKYPDASFQMPESPVPMPLTVFEDMSYCGHLAIYGTCHIAYKDKCVTPPKSHLSYTPAHQGTVQLDSGGLLRVARLSYGANHAAHGLNPRATADHYENTALCGGFARIIDGELGIWMSGHLNRQADDDVHSIIASAAASGDWRKIRRNLELVGVLSVNIPGFPIPDAEIFEDRGEQTALVASGLQQMLDVDPAEGHQWAAARLERKAVNAVRARQRLSLLDTIAERAGMPTRSERLAEMAARVNGDRA